MSKKSARTCSGKTKLRDKIIMKRDMPPQHNIHTGAIQMKPNGRRDLQQSILDVFTNSFSERFNDASLTASIQEVKSHLFSRDFSKAFGSGDLLEAYAIRWSPSRALAYMDLFCSLAQLLAIFHDAPSRASPEETLVSLQLDDFGQRDPHSASDKPTVKATAVTQAATSRGTTVMCFGGGAAAEILAFAGLLHCLQARRGEHSDVAGIDDSADVSATNSLTLNIMDMADWSSVVNNIHQKLTTCPPSSKYVSTTKATKCEPFVDPAQFVVNFAQKDILNVDIDRLRVALQDTALITLTFTLNELYSTSISKTTNFLLNLTYLSAPGTLLLIADSPGSYSTVRVGKASSGALAEPERKYPMRWLLDHTLLEASSIKSVKNAVQKPQWEKLVSDDSRWFRLPKDLKYPLDLEDMRYQYHLFKRL